MHSLADNGDPVSLSSKLRRKRFERLLDHLGQASDLRPESALRILDIGGTQNFWRVHLPLIHQNFPLAEVLIINLAIPPIQMDIHGLSARVGDARNLSGFSDKSFDLVMSNSVIEHVGTLFDQKRMADEVQRVGRHFFIQTPNRSFILEPHFHVPFWIHFPLSWRAWMLNHWKLGWVERQRDPLLSRAEVEQIRLLRYWELSAIFPGASIESERVFGLTKSYMVFDNRSLNSI